ncbi:MAG: hypothetical protein HUJ68_03515 [Clostridia bacterium]|nr:hypothetical protein [Clostridia bacterium]
MSEDEFSQKIKPTIESILDVFNLILNDGETEGLYPQEELHLLEEKKNELMKDLKVYQEVGDQKSIQETWDKLGDIMDTLKNNKYSPMMDLIFKALASVEELYHTYILKDTQE